MGKISDYANVLKSKLTDLFVVYQRNDGELETKNATLEQLGDAICGEQVHATLETDDQTIIGGINEVDEKVDNATTKTSGTITAGSGCVVRLGSLIKINGVVFGSFAINMTTPISSRTTIGHIPAGLRPRENVSFMAPSSSAVNSYQDRITNLIITTDGEIIAGDICVPAGKTIKEVSLAFSYDQGN